LLQSGTPFCLSLFRLRLVFKKNMGFFERLLLFFMMCSISPFPNIVVGCRLRFPLLFPRILLQMLVENKTQHLPERELPPPALAVQKTPGISLTNITPGGTAIRPTGSDITFLGNRMFCRYLFLSPPYHKASPPLPGPQ